MNAPALFRAVEQGRTDLIQVLLAGEPEPALSGEDKAELLRWSSYFGDVTACRLLVANGLSLSVLGEDLGLAAAAFHGHWKLCQYLLECGASARFTDPKTGETPLHLALTNENRTRYDAVVVVLLRAGAEPNAATLAGMASGSFMRDSVTRGETPLHRAALFGTVSTIELLRAAGARLEATDARGESPLAWASWARRPIDVLRALLYGEHRIHPDYRSLRESLLGRPESDRGG